jgi:uncharacterized RDD family membrane protein YckC/DNA-directed RNA polymerase subunit RPC12/RpoP
MGTNTVKCPQCQNANFYTASDNVIRCQYCGANIFIDKQPAAAPQQPTQQTPRPIINLSGDTDVLDSQAANYELASNMQRLVNFIVDRMTSYFLLFLIIGFADSNPATGEFTILFALFMIPAYYVLLEGVNGKTLGKYLSGTRAVNEDGSKFGYGTAFIRTLCRLIPLEPISIFFSNGVCWHDTISKTRVIKDR